MMRWAADGDGTPMALEFEDTNTLQILEGGQKRTTSFKRGQRVGYLPEIPWETEAPCKSGGIRKISAAGSFLILFAIFANFYV